MGRERLYLMAISSSFGSLLLFLLLHSQPGIITGVSGASEAAATQQQQKCDKVVTVETVELLSYLGNVTFVAPTPFSGRWTTVIKFTSPYTFIGGWGVEVKSSGTKSYAIFTSFDEEQLKAGDPVIFQFRVLYGLTAKVPKVHSIRWENTPICGPATAMGSLSSASQWDHIGGVITFDPESSEEGEGDDASSASSDDDLGDQRLLHLGSNNVRVEHLNQSAVGN